jgi:aspartyl-tRNA(Asn)/glutamyl-tRNA(Gln) amidotransferase subunit B
MNRCGVPLLEIVTEPDLNSADEAHACLSELRQLLQWTGVCGCDMEKGELRCDVNVSLRPGEGARTEIKNLNSFKAVRDAINHEIVRQTRALSAGGTVAADTRLWNEALRRTEPMRAKETAGDYRYFPEPDLPPLRVSREVLEAARQADCDLPRCARERFRRDFAMNAAEAGAVSASRELAAYAEACMRVAATLGLGAKPVMRILGGEFLARLNELKIPHAEIAEKAIKPEALARIAALAAAGKVSASAEKVIFAKAWETGRAPEELLKELGLAQVSDPERLKVWAGAAIAEEPEAAQAIRNGNDRAMGPLVAALMRKSGGSANPRLAAETIKELLS